MLPADDRYTVAVIEILRRPLLLAEKGRRVVLDALVALFDDHVALGQDVFLVQLEVDHAITLHLHHQLKTIGGDTLKIGCVIVTGKCIVGAAIARDGGRKLARRHIFSAFEEKVLKEMCHA